MRQHDETPARHGGLRIAVQILLSLPATLMLPVGWFVPFVGYNAQFDAPASAYFTKASLFLLGSLIGLIALWRSICFIQAGKLKGPSWLLVLGLVVGLSLDLYLLCGVTGSQSKPDMSESLFSAWILGGPLLVGIWNLIMIWRSEKAL